MPSMLEIYAAHAARYDELVAFEDARGELAAFLAGVPEFDRGTVYEAGTGTGRVTRYYIDRAARAFCTDGSPHMLECARRRLTGHADRITYAVADNAALPALPEGWPPADVFVEGWSFGHSAVVQQDPQAISAVAAAFVQRAQALVRPGGLLLFLETLGSNVDAPNPPAPALDRFYRELEATHGFIRRQLRTDFRFPDLQTAVDLMGFFFGPAMADAVRTRGSAEVAEWTGAWVCRVG